MTLNDLNKRIKDKDKVIVLVGEDGGWTNIELVEETLSTIDIKPDYNMPFDD